MQAVTWAIMKPLLSPGSAERNGGRRETPASMSMAMRPLGDRADLGDRDRHRVGGKRDRARRGSCRR
jgi:hypothetical protein